MCCNNDALTNLFLTQHVVDENFVLNSTLDLLHLPKLTDVQMKALKALLETEIKVFDAAEQHHLFSFKITELLKKSKELIDSIPGMKWEGFELVGSAVAAILETDPSYFEEIVSLWCSDSGKLTLKFPKRNIRDIDIRIKIAGGTEERRNELLTRLLRFYTELSAKQEPEFLAKKVIALYSKNVFIPDALEFETRLKKHYIDPNCKLLNPSDVELLNKIACNYFKSVIFNKKINTPDPKPDSSEAKKPCNRFLLLGLGILETTAYSELLRSHLISLDAPQLNLTSGKNIPGPSGKIMAQGLCDRMLELARIDQPDKVNEFDFWKLMSARTQGCDLPILSDEPLSLMKCVDALKTEKGRYDFKNYLDNHYKNDHLGLALFLWHCFVAYRIHAKPDDLEIFVSLIKPTIDELKKKQLPELVVEGLETCNLKTNDYQEFLLAIQAMREIVQCGKGQTAQKVILRKHVKGARIKLPFFKAGVDEAPCVLQVPIIQGLSFQQVAASESCRSRLQRFMQKQFIQGTIDSQMNDAQLWLNFATNANGKRDFIIQLIKNDQVMLALELLEQWFNLEDHVSVYMDCIQALIINDNANHRAWKLSQAILLIEKLSSAQERLNFAQETLQYLLRETKSKHGNQLDGLFIRSLKILLAGLKTHERISVDCIRLIIESLKASIQPSQSLTPQLQNDLSAISLKIILSIPEADPLLLNEWIDLCKTLKITFPTNPTTLRLILRAYTTCNLPMVKESIKRLPAILSSWKEEDRIAFLQANANLIELGFKISDESALIWFTFFNQYPVAIAVSQNLVAQEYKRRLEASPENAHAILSEKSYNFIFAEIQNFNCDSWSKVWKSLPADCTNDVLKTLWKCWIAAAQDFPAPLWQRALHCCTPIQTEIAEDVFSKLPDLKAKIPEDAANKVAFVYLLISALLALKDRQKALEELKLLVRMGSQELKEDDMSPEWVRVYELYIEQLIAHVTPENYVAACEYALKIFNKLQSIKLPVLLVGGAPTQVADDPAAQVNQAFDKLFALVKGHKDFTENLGKIIYSWAKSGNSRFVKWAFELVEQYEVIPKINSAHYKAFILAGMKFHADLKEKLARHLSLPRFSKLMTETDWKECALTWLNKCIEVHKNGESKETTPIRSFLDKDLVLIPSVVILPEFQKLLFDWVLEHIPPKQPNFCSIIIGNVEGLIVEHHKPALEVRQAPMAATYQEHLKTPDASVVRPMSISTADMAKIRHDHELMEEIARFKCYALGRLMHKFSSANLSDPEKAIFLDLLNCKLIDLTLYISTVKEMSLRKEVLNLIKQFAFLIPPADVAFFEFHLNTSLSLFRSAVDEHLPKIDLTICYEVLFYLGNNVTVPNHDIKSYTIDEDKKYSILKNLVMRLVRDPSDLKSRDYAVYVFCNSIITNKLSNILDLLPAVLQYVIAHPFRIVREKKIISLFNYLEIVVKNRSLLSNRKPVKECVEIHEIAFKGLITIAENHRTHLECGNPSAFFPINWLTILGEVIFGDYNSGYRKEIRKLIPLFVESLNALGKNLDQIKPWLDQFLIFLFSKHMVKNTDQKRERAKIVLEFVEQVVKKKMPLSHFIGKIAYMQALAYRVMEGYDEECGQMVDLINSCHSDVMPAFPPD